MGLSVVVEVYSLRVWIFLEVILVDERGGGVICGLKGFETY